LEESTNIMLLARKTISDNFEEEPQVS